MVYTRRRTLSLLSLSGVGLLAGCAGESGSLPSTEDSETTTQSTTTATTETTAPSPETTTAPPETTVESPETSTESAVGELVAIDNVAFSPIRLGIDAGTTVVWENREGLNHNVRARQFHDVATDWVFQSETVGRDGRITHRFEEEGIYEYECGIHGSQAMCGAILVGDVTLEEPLPCEE